MLRSSASTSNFMRLRQSSSASALLAGQGDLERSIRIVSFVVKSKSFFSSAKIQPTREVTRWS